MHSPFATAPTLAAGTSTEAAAAPATVTDSPGSRRLNIHIPPLALLLPVAALVAYLFVNWRPASHTDARPVEPVPAQTAAPAPDHAQPEAELAANGDAVEPPRADLDRLRQRAQRSSAQAQQLSDARSRVKVNVYYTERCPHCSEAHGYLVAHGIQAIEHDVDKDPRARTRLRKLNPKGSLPTIEVEGQVLAGFDAGRLEHALDRAARAHLRRGR